MKIIIWGYPLYSHTHSYIHDAFYKAFKYLNYETYWFDDNNYPKDFDWNDCLFWTALKLSSIHFFEQLH
jgi:hypothetical protein